MSGSSHRLVYRSAKRICLQYVSLSCSLAQSSLYIALTAAFIIDFISSSVICENSGFPAQAVQVLPA